MNGGKGTYGSGADHDGSDLEVIELEPAMGTERSESRRNRSRATDTRRRRAPVLIAIVIVVALVTSVLINQSHRSDRNRERASTSTTRPGQLRTEFPGALLFPFRVGAQVLTGGSNGLQVTDTDTGGLTYPAFVGCPTAW